MTLELLSSPPSFNSIAVAPTAQRYEVLLTAIAPLSHHDPAVQTDSNRTLFNRQRQLMTGTVDAVLPSQSVIDSICVQEAVPADVADLFDGLGLAEFMACAMVRRFLDLYNISDGQGVFSGMERYGRLEARARMASVVAPTLRVWWDTLCNSLQVEIAGGEHDGALLRLFALPSGLHQLVLRVLERDYRSTVMLARAWHQAGKLQSDTYAASAGQERGSAESVVLSFAADATSSGSTEARVLDIPAVSGNSLRHQLVREPGWLHLCAALGIMPGTLAPGVEAIFYNGGNIRAGAKQPTDPYRLSWKIREIYPLLDLLGGVTDSFDLGESRLKIGGWLVCRENARALEGSPAADLPSATVSIFDLLDDVTLTRQAGRTGQGQMIYSFETLCPGAQILARLDLQPYTPRLSHGALLCALDYYLANDGTIGGQAARGFGHMRGEVIASPTSDLDALRAEYRSYLADAADSLQTGMLDGTLGSGLVILS